MTAGMFDEDIPSIGDVPAERIRAAVEKAREAFWSAIAEEFPEIRTGDLSPGDTMAMETATNSVVVAWIFGNHPTTEE